MMMELCKYYIVYVLVALVLLAASCNEAIRTKGTMANEGVHKNPQSGIDSALFMNCLIERHDFKGEWEKIKKIDLSGYLIRAIPKYAVKAKNVEVIDLQNCAQLDFGQSFEVFSKLQKVKKVLLCSNSLESIPEKIPRTVEELDVRNNNLSSILEVVNLTDLKVLSLSGNEPLGEGLRFSHLNNLTELESLSLDFCGIKRLPEDEEFYLSKKKLLQLNLDWNEIDSIPYLFKKFPVRYITLHGNPIEDKRIDLFHPSSIVSW